MKNDGLVKRHPRKSEYEAALWSLPGIKKPIGAQFREHYIDTTNLLVKYWEPQHWDEKWMEEDFQTYTIDQTVPMYDARMKKWNTVFYWEVDRGTEEMEELFEKVNKYIKLSNKHPNDKFHVIFTMQYFRFGIDQSPEQRLKKLRDRSYELVEYLGAKKRGNQFLVAWHDQVIADPYGPVFISPLNPNVPISLESVTNVLTGDADANPNS